LAVATHPIEESVAPLLPWVVPGAQQNGAVTRALGVVFPGTRSGCGAGAGRARRVGLGLGRQPPVRQLLLLAKHPVPSELSTADRYRAADRRHGVVELYFIRFNARRDSSSQVRRSAREHPSGPKVAVRTLKRCPPFEGPPKNQKLADLVAGVAGGGEGVGVARTKRDGGRGRPERPPPCGGIAFQARTLGEEVSLSSSSTTAASVFRTPRGPAGGLSLRVRSYRNHEPLT